MKAIKNKISYFVVSLYYFLLAHPVLAQIEARGGNTCNSSQIYTAIGCVPVQDPNLFAIFLLQWFFGVGGGIALLLIAMGSFQILTSSGDPKKVQAGREIITAAITGLLFLIFSMFILRFLGVEILNINFNPSETTG